MNQPIKSHPHATVELGELVAAAFDRAALLSSDPVEVTRLATDEVLALLRHARRQEDERHEHVRRGRLH